MYLFYVDIRISDDDPKESLLVYVPVVLQSSFSDPSGTDISLLLLENDLDSCFRPFLAVILTTAFSQSNSCSRFFDLKVQNRLNLRVTFSTNQFQSSNSFMASDICLSRWAIRSVSSISWIWSDVVSVCSNSNCFLTSGDKMKHDLSEPLLLSSEHFCCWCSYSPKSYVSAWV